jgi:hypothetical protein
MSQHHERHLVSAPIDRVAECAQRLAWSQERGIGDRGGWLSLRVAADGLPRVRDQLPGRIDDGRFFFRGKSGAWLGPSSGR